MVIIFFIYKYSSDGWILILYCICAQVMRKCGETVGKNGIERVQKVLKNVENGTKALKQFSESMQKR